MIDQLVIEDKASFDDFGASLSKRSVGMPKKKSIKETVPFSNKTYDFSAINGEIYWDERELEYTFEMIAPTPEELEEMKAKFAGWVMPLMEAKIFDPFIEDYHFVGTFDELKFDDDEGLDKTTATVKFSAYPYRLANLPKKYAAEVVKTGIFGGSATLTIVNNSAHPVLPTLKVTGDDVIIKIGNASFSVSSGEYTDAGLMLGVGTTEWVIQSQSTASVEVTFIEEVI